MNVTSLPALNDNYIWLVEVDDQAIVVDPGEADVVLRYLEEQELQLHAILITHKHEDHINGVLRIKEVYPDVLIYGPSEVAELVTQIVKDGDHIRLFDQVYSVVLTAGHTTGHVSYLVEDALFCGDALFSAGCGRVFTNDYKAQYASLYYFKQLPDTVKVYAGHEYTLTNLQFALTLDPTNEYLKQQIEKVKRQREKDQPSLPSTIGIEKRINPFLRAESLQEFIEWRQMRDRF